MRTLLDVRFGRVPMLRVCYIGERSIRRPEVARKRWLGMSRLQKGFAVSAVVVFLSLFRIQAAYQKTTNGNVGTEFSCTATVKRPANIC